MMYVFPVPQLNVWHILLTFIMHFCLFDICDSIFLNMVWDDFIVNVRDVSTQQHLESTIISIVQEMAKNEMPYDIESYDPLDPNIPDP